MASNRCGTKVKNCRDWLILSPLNLHFLHKDRHLDFLMKENLFERFTISYIPGQVHKYDIRVIAKCMNGALLMPSVDGLL